MGLSPGEGFACKEAECGRVFKKANGLARHIQASGHDDSALLAKHLKPAKPRGVKRDLKSYSFKAKVLRRVHELEALGAADIGPCIKVEYPEVADYALSRWRKDSERILELAGTFFCLKDEL